MRILSACLLSLALVTALVPKNSHAVVGLLIKSSTTKTVGGVVAVGGLGVAVLSGRIIAEGWTALGYALSGLMLAGIGLLVLDESQSAEVVYRKVQTVHGFSAADIATYNSEIEELNAIHQTVEAQLRADSSLDAVDLWNEYKNQLSPATIKLAAYHGKRLLESLR